VHGFVPVKDLAKLLTSLQGVTGPVEEDGSSRRITLPSGVELTITEKDGWAVIAPASMATTAVDPAPLLAAVAKEYTVGIDTFPSRMSDAVRKMIEAGIDQAGAASAAQGQPVDTGAMKAAIDGLRQTESLSLGAAIDNEHESVFIENRSTAVPGSLSAAVLKAAGDGTLTVATAAAGKSPAIRGYAAQSVSDESRKEFLAALDQTLPRDADDPLTKTIATLLRELLAAALAAGGIDAAIAVDTTTATEKSPLPAVTAGLRVKDGAALEQQVKKIFAAGNAVPAGVKVKFDTAKAGPANLHTIVVDLGDSPAAEQFGASLDLTLAVAKDYAFLLTGGDLQERVDAALKASGRADPDAKPLAGLQVAMSDMLAYAAKQGAGPQVEAAAERAASADSALVKLSVRPIDRGLVTRLSADSGVLKAAAALGGQTPAPVGPGGIPLPQAPAGFPIPVPTR